jgi:pSer/pThr/pTyr-binding forkhead associated (FHA) protein
LITCNRCGKENQDHYKFCLGCGNELAKMQPPLAVPPQPAESGVSAAEGQPPAPMESARTALPGSLQGAAGELKSATGAAATAGKQKGGIPWNDNPKMPAQFGAQASFQLPPNPLAGPVPTATAPPPAGARRPSGAVPAAPAAAPGESACPKCGKSIAPGFAFCGSCGTRINRAPSGANNSLTAQRTMHMAAGSIGSSGIPRGRLVLIRPDGSEGGAYSLHEGENLIGRGQGALFDSDAYLSPRHGEFSIGPNGLIVRDLRSLNGVFLKITSEESLESGDVFRIGQELLRFELISAPQPMEDGTDIMGTPNPGFWGRLSVVVGRDVDGSAFPLFGEAVVLGRERGDILFPEDGYVSGAHARISLNDGRVSLADLGSSNGTFLRIRGERALTEGSFILMGQQLFRVEFR